MVVGWTPVDELQLGGLVHDRNLRVSPVGKNTQSDGPYLSTRRVGGACT